MTKDQKLLEEAYKLISEKKKPLYKIKPDGFIVWLGKEPDLTGSPEVVEGGFYCANNTFLKSLKGGPKVVKGGYSCYACNLKSLEGVSEIVEGDFYCSWNNDLTSLRDGPRAVKGNYCCSNCDLESLEGVPEVIGGSFSCDGNISLKTLKGGPRIVKGDYSCSSCNLETLEGAPEAVGGDFDCSNNPLKSIKGLPKAKSYQLPESFTDNDIKKEFKRQEKEKFLNTTDKDTRDTFGDLIHGI